MYFQKFFRIANHWNPNRYMNKYIKNTFSLHLSHVHMLLSFTLKLKITGLKSYLNCCPYTTLNFKLYENISVLFLFLCLLFRRLLWFATTDFRTGFFFFSATSSLLFRSSLSHLSLLSASRFRSSIFLLSFLHLLLSILIS